MSLFGRVRRSGTPRISTGERVLAWARSEDGAVLVGTRDALHVVDGTEDRIGWEQVDTAGWDEASSTLRFTLVDGVATSTSHAHRLTDARALLELLRERVTASVVLQREVAVPGHGGLTVVARRPPSGAVEVVWSVRYDDGTDPSHPVVREALAEALGRAKDDVGHG